MPMLQNPVMESKEKLHKPPFLCPPCYIENLCSKLPPSPLKLRAKRLASLIWSSETDQSLLSMLPDEVTIRNDKDEKNPGFLLTFYQTNGGGSKTKTLGEDVQNIGYGTFLYGTCTCQTPSKQTTTKLRGLYITPSHRKISLGSMIINFWIKLSKLSFNLYLGGDELSSTSSFASPSCPIYDSVNISTCRMRKPLICKLLRENGMSPIDCKGHAVTIVKEIDPSQPDGTVCLVGRGLESILSKSYCVAQGICINPSVPFRVISSESIECGFEGVLSFCGGAGKYEKLLSILWVEEMEIVVPNEGDKTRTKGGDIFARIASQVQNKKSKTLEGVENWYNTVSLKNHNKLRSTLKDQVLILHQSLLEDTAFIERGGRIKYTVDRYVVRITSTLSCLFDSKLGRLREFIDNGCEIVDIGGPGFEIKGVKCYRDVRDKCGIEGIDGKVGILSEVWRPMAELVNRGEIEIFDHGCNSGKKCWFFCYVLAESWRGVTDEDGDGCGGEVTACRAELINVLSNALTGSWIVLGDSVRTVYDLAKGEGGDNWEWIFVGLWIVGRKTEENEYKSSSRSSEIM